MTSLLATDKKNHARKWTDRSSVFGAILALLCFAASANVENWPSFRGPQASGVGSGTPPVEWDIATGKHVRWQIPVPGLGHSSPVIWGPHLYLTTAVSSKEQPVKTGLYGDIRPVVEAQPFEWRLLCIDKQSGKIVWQQNALSAVPRSKRHPKSSHANSTPATNGDLIVTFFGSEGLFCYDRQGKLRWKHDLGALDAGYYQHRKAQWGFGSSPVIYQNRVIIQCDVQDESYVASYDLASGEKQWQTKRGDVPTWCTPTVCELKDEVLVLLNGYRHLGAYEFATGQPRWWLKGGGDIPVPTPIVAHNLAFFSSAHGRMAPIYAIALGAKGDISLAKGKRHNHGVKWSRRSEGSYMPTPIVYGSELYVCLDNGIVSCYDARNGTRHYRHKLPAAAFTASPVAANGKLYFNSEDGDVFVVQAGIAFKLVATNTLPGRCLATPAISGGMIYYRTVDRLIAFGTANDQDQGSGRNR